MSQEFQHDLSQMDQMFCDTAPLLMSQLMGCVTTDDQNHRGCCRTA